MTLEEGSVLGGYRIVRLIGRGGMGAVYLAVDTRLGRNVALKVLAPETAEVPQVRERFVRESHLAASLDHPHILPIFDAGEAEGQLFMAMRYVPGPDLAGVIARDGPLPLERTVAIVDQVGSALDAAHAAGLIHRDVKPGNILVATGSQPGTDHAYLADFGLTKHAEYSSALTRSGQLMGSVGYVAPEQIENRPIDGRVDVYSLGCVLYECLAGSQPYPRDTEMATLYAHVQAPPPSLAAVRPELPPTLDAVIAKALAKDPDERYSSAGALAQALASASAPDATARHLTRGFLFADLRGYTAFVEARGDAAAAALLDAYRRLVRDVVRRFGGAEIKTEGDSFYVVFPSASDAVRCGLALVAAAEGATNQQPSRPIAVGIGVHAGETAETPEGYVGSAVNLAARLCAQAAAGEVLVSDTVRGLTRTSGEVTFTARGRKHLKGIAEPIAVYAATAAVAGMGAAPPVRPPITTRVFGFGDPRRVVVAAGGAAAAVALAALLVVGAFGGGFGGGPRPSHPAGGSPSGPGGPVGQGGPSASNSAAPSGIIAFVRGYADAAGPADPSTSCVGLFGGFPGGANIWVMRDDGSNAAPITTELDGNDAAPSLSPDGATVAYLGTDAKFHTASVRGTSVATLPTPGSTLPLSWSPDGRRVAYIGTVGSAGALAAYAANADGSDAQLVWQPPPPVKAATRFRLVDTGPTPGPKVATAESLSTLDWLPDGRLALLISHDGVDASGVVVSYGPSRLYAVSASGTDLTPLTPDLPFVWPDASLVPISFSPDGRRFALAGSIDRGPVAVYVLNIDGSGLTRLTHDAGPDEDPAWSPDGQEIAFSSRQGAIAQIEVVPAAGGVPRQLTHTSDDVVNCQPTWRLSAGPLPSPPRIARGDAGDPLTLHPGDLAAGVYASAPFAPTFQVTLPSGWLGANLSTDGLYLFRVATLRERLEVSQVQVVFGGDCLNSPTKIIGSAPLDFIRWIQSDKDLKVGQVGPVTVGGATGLAFSVTVRHVPGSACGFLGYKTVLYPISHDQFALQADDVANFLVLDVKGTRVIVTLFGRASDLAATSDEVQSILGSITFP